MSLSSPFVLGFRSFDSEHVSPSHCTFCPPGCRFQLFSNLSVEGCSAYKLTPSRGQLLWVSPSSPTSLGRPSAPFSVLSVFLRRSYRVFLLRVCYKWLWHWAILFQSLSSCSWLPEGPTWWPPASAQDISHHPKLVLPFTSDPVALLLLPLALCHR